MVQSPSWEANWFAASQEIPCISRNPKAHYRTHKRPPPVSILGQPNPVHIPTSHLLEIHPNIIHPSTPRPPQWSLSLRFPHQDPIHPPLLSPICATCPAHLILLDFINQTHTHTNKHISRTAMELLNTLWEPQISTSACSDLLQSAALAARSLSWLAIYLFLHQRYVQKRVRKCENHA